MPIIFKLVGHVNSSLLEIKHDISGIVKLSSIISIFENYGISQESFEYIKFVIESETLKDDSKIFQISNENLIIFVFTCNEEIFKKLIKIFLENEINKEITNTEVNNNSEHVNKEITNTEVDNNLEHVNDILENFNNNSEHVDEELTKPVVDNNSEHVNKEITNTEVDNNLEHVNDILENFNNNSEHVDEELTKPVVDNNLEHVNDISKNFNNNSEQVDKEITKPVVDKIQEEQIPELSQEIIDTINIKTAKIFENNDFKHLIRIYYSNPDILKTFLNFVSQGNIVKMNIPIISEEKDYSVEIETLKSLGINESDDIIKQVLGSFNGHLNLSLRVLLTRSAIKFDT